MSFMSKAENNTPLESKVMAGGARTQRGQEHYQKKLKGVAEWTRNQQLMKEGLPPTPADPAQFELPVKESLRVEYRQLIDIINNVIESGLTKKTIASVFSSEAKALFRVVIRLLILSSGSEIADMIRDFDTAIEEPFEELMDPSLRGNEAGDQTLSVIAQDAYLAYFSPISQLMAKYIKYADEDDKTKQLGLRTVLNEIIGKKKTPSIMAFVRQMEREMGTPGLSPASSASTSTSTTRSSSGSTTPSTGPSSGYNTPPARPPPFRREAGPLRPLPVELTSYEGRPSPF
jgi:hypothetical protein